MKAKKYIKYPFEYIAAQVEFGSAIARITKLRRVDVFKKYTDLYGALTNHQFANKGQPWIGETLYKLDRLLSKKYSQNLSKQIYDLFLSTPDIYETVPSPYTDELKFGCFRLNYSNYYKTQGLVRLHFSPLRSGLLLKDDKFKTSDLSPVYLHQRQSEFRSMIEYIYNNPQQFEGATHFYSSTWMQNLSVYQSFFPTSRKKLVRNLFFWQWGQFMRWDFSGNESRYVEFKKNLTKARSLRQVINCIPYKVYEVKIPLNDMFAFYGLGDVLSSAPTQPSKMNLEFYTSHPLLQRTAC